MGKKTYLGDSVYVEIERGMFKLTTENGHGPSNTIYLEPFVFEFLKNYVEQEKEIARMKEQLKS